MIERSDRGLCLFIKVGNNLKILKELSQVGCIRQFKNKINDQIKKRTKFHHI